MQLLFFFFSCVSPSYPVQTQCRTGVRTETLGLQGLSEDSQDADEGTMNFDCLCTSLKYYTFHCVLLHFMTISVLNTFCSLSQ